MSKTIREYRVRPVTRYVVTEWKRVTDDEGRSASSITTLGTFDNEQHAEQVAKALGGVPVADQLLHQGGSPEARRAAIRRVMAEQNLQAAQWAKRAGIASSTLYNFLNANTSRSLSQDVLEKLAAAANVPIRRLLP